MIFKANKRLIIKICNAIQGARKIYKANCNAYKRNLQVNKREINTIKAKLIANKINSNTACFQKNIITITLFS